MSRFAPGASFAVVAQKDGSFAVEVHEPKRAVPLRITGYASEAAARAAIEGFLAPKPLEAPGNPVPAASAVAETSAAQTPAADKRDMTAVPAGKRGNAASAKSPARKKPVQIATKAARKRQRPRG